VFKKNTFSKLMSPFHIQQVDLRNRLVKTASAMGLATEDGYVTDANLGFYEAVSKGGVGLIIVEHGFVDYPMGVTGPRRIAISDDKFIPGLKKLVQVIHKHGAACFQQLGHSGPHQRWLLATDQRPVSSSSHRPVPSALHKEPRGLSISEIGDLVQKYASAAKRAKEAGFDGIEISASASYLLNSFLSRAWNIREDAYGCEDSQSRARFLIEILRAIKEVVGDSFPVGVRINGAEYGLENGITSEESQKYATIIEDTGGAFINIGGPGYGQYQLFAFPEQSKYPEPSVPLAKKVHKPGAWVPTVEAIRQVVTIPVIAVGRLDAALGNWILKKGKADLVGINRRLIADPEYPNKVASGRLEDIAPCTACLHCWDTQQAGVHIRCRINAALGREYESVILPAKRKKKVLIVGGGPAGMEAARVAALRGHEVVLYEKGHRLGGLLPLAAFMKGSDVEDLLAIVSYLRTQMRRLGVEVRTKSEVSLKTVETVRPDVVVIASGGMLTTARVPGMTRGNVLSNVTLHHKVKPYLRLLGPKVLRWLSKLYLPLGEKVVILGGSMHGCEVAEFLVKRGREVTIVETSDQLGAGIHGTNRPRLLSWLKRKGVMMLTNVTIKEIIDKGLTIVTKEGNNQTIEADTIVLATPPIANTQLEDDLKRKVKELYLIGDSKEPRSIIEAITDGWQIGHTI